MKEYADGRRNILQLLAVGSVGGIENLCRDYIAISVHKNTVVIMWDGGEVSDEMEANGAEVITLHISSWKIRSTCKKILKICVDKKIDTVIVQHAAPLAHICLIYIKKKMPHIKTIAYAHAEATDLIHEGAEWRSFLRKLILKESFKKADAAIAISESVKRSVINTFELTEKRIDVIYNGVDTKRYVPSKRRLKDTVKLIVVSRLIYEKGIQIIIEGTRYFPQEFAFHVSIAGEGPYRKELEKLVQQYGLEDKITFLGVRRDIPQLLQESDIFLHTPVWQEGFGITVIEAMAAGVIPVCAKSGAIPEIIEDGINGFLVEQNDPRAAADKIVEVVNMPEEKRDEIRQRVRKRAEEFSIEKYAEKMDELIARNA